MEGSEANWLIIHIFHKGMMAQVLDSGILSDQFCVCNGTKQGCVLAPLLFSIYFAMMLLVAFWNCNIGVPIQFRTDGSVFNLRRLQAQTKVQCPIIGSVLSSNATVGDGISSRLSKANVAFGRLNRCL